MSKRTKVSLSEFLCKQLLDFYFGGLRKLDNYYPDWLNGLEIDRYYPEIKVGLEFQGIQHYRPTPRFQASRSEFFGQLKSDTDKIQLAQKARVQIFPISLYDITKESHKDTFKKIAKYGIQVARAQNDTKTYRYLTGIRWDKDPDPTLFKRLEGIRKSPRWRTPKPAKKNFLKRLFGF